VEAEQVAEHVRSPKNWPLTDHEARGNHSGDRLSYFDEDTNG
jgi:hypothetical protein